MTNTERIRRSIRSIEDRLGENLRVSDIACEAGYSLYHFIRLFSAVTGLTPKEYILQRKLSEAAKIIASTDRRIIDIAFDFEFQTHESFTRAFRRFFGENPADYRRAGKRNENRFLEPMTSVCSRDGESLPYTVVTLGKMHFTGLSVFMRDDVRLIAEMWNAFARNLHRISRRKVPERFFQVSYWLEDQSMNGFFCMAAAETEDLSVVPDDMCGKTAAPAKYLRFIHKGISRDVGRTYECIYGTVLPATEFVLPLPYNIELYGEGYRGPNDPESESEIYIPVAVASSEA